MLKSLNTTKLFCYGLLAFVLIGCGTTPPVKKPTQAPVSIIAATMSPTDYLDKASKANEPNKTHYLLLAAEAYLNANNTGAADEILRSLTLGKSLSVQAKAKYLKARVLAQYSEFSAALNELTYPQSWTLPDWQVIAYYEYRAKLYALLKNPVEQVRELSLLHKYLSPEQSNKTNEEIWQSLKLIDEDTLRGLMNDTSNPIAAGWMQLAFIAKHYAVEPADLISYLGRWQQQNPYHPGAMKLPADLDNAINAKPYKPKRIAVLLPLTGPRAKVASAVKHGLLASYMAEHNPKLALSFFDTNLGAAQAYQAAEQSGAEFIIGPLLQSEVEQVQQLTQNSERLIPQLFLNQAQQIIPHQDRFYFSLSPAQEAADTAFRLYQDGIEQPLVLASSDATGKRMAQSFNEAWLELMDKEAEVHFYSQGAEMKQAVQEALGVKESLERIKRIKALLGSKIKADFRSRRDIDGIYMISGKRDLLLLKPFIDVSFSVFAEPVPLYASSRSRIDDENAQTAQELNQLTISDIPWLLQSSDEVRTVDKLWPTWSNGQKRLYIMGYDSLQLVSKLAQMRAFPGYQYQGRSGELSVDESGVLNRHLSWAKYQRGKLRKL